MGNLKLSSPPPLPPSHMSSYKVSCQGGDQLGLFSESFVTVQKASILIKDITKFNIEGCIDAKKKSFFCWIL